MDKLAKVRAEVERKQLYTQSEVLKQVLDYIDEVQKEPVSILHNASKKHPLTGKEIIVLKDDKIYYGKYIDGFRNRYVHAEIQLIDDTAQTYAIIDYLTEKDKWIYVEDLLNLPNAQKTTKNWEDPVSEDFVKTFISMVNATHENNGSYSLYEYAQRLYNIAKDTLSKSESEDLEEAADVYSKVFSDIAAPYIRKDAFIAGAKWQQEKEYTCYEEAFEDGAKWKAEQFEEERLKHCDGLTEAQAQIESDFVTQHIKENNRMPTFIDAIEYGMRLKEKEMQSTIELAEDHAMLAGMEKMKEEMMKDAIDAKIWSFTNGTIYDADFNIDSNLKDNDKVKVIIIKEE